ncbi:MAG: hypothetical protein PHG07_11565 [Lachnospiraceae bacterium]|nr:hypothetical protein [Lachnospiraceae bacterium]
MKTVDKNGWQFHIFYSSVAMKVLQFFEISIMIMCKNAYLAKPGNPEEIYRVLVKR